MGWGRRRHDHQGCGLRAAGCEAAARVIHVNVTSGLNVILAERPHPFICPDTVHFAENDRSGTGSWFLQQSASFLSLGQATREEGPWAQFNS
jgi:hypothetical protein